MSPGCTLNDVQKHVAMFHASPYRHAPKSRSNINFVVWREGMVVRELSRHINLGRANKHAYFFGFDAFRELPECVQTIIENIEKIEANRKARKAKDENTARLKTWRTIQPHTQTADR